MYFLWARLPIAATAEVHQLKQVENEVFRLTTHKNETITNHTKTTSIFSVVEVSNLCKKNPCGVMTIKLFTDTRKSVNVYARICGCVDHSTIHRHTQKGSTFTHVFAGVLTTQLFTDTRKKGQRLRSYLRVCWPLNYSQTHAKVSTFTLSYYLRVCWPLNYSQTHAKRVHVYARICGCVDH